MPMQRLPACLALAVSLAAPAAAQLTFDDNPTRLHRLQLDYNGVGYVVPKGKIRLSNYIRMHPAGFRADEYDMYLAPTYGLGAGWQVTAGVTGAERRGRGGNALFGGAGVQKQFVTESALRPAVSVGLYGMTGHDHDSGVAYLAASKRVWTFGQQGFYLHGGARFEAYDSDDYGDSTGIRPYFGATYAFGPRLSLGAEISPKQAWERDLMFAVRANVRVYKRFGITGGIRNNGFDTHPFVGVSF
jgi:hypothetical protein